VRDHLILHDIMDQYTRRVRHRENIEIVDNNENIVRDESRGYYTDDLNLAMMNKMYQIIKM
jgi:hypothetical protein